MEFHGSGTVPGHGSRVFCFPRLLGECSAEDEVVANAVVKTTDGKNFMAASNRFRTPELWQRNRIAGVDSG